MKQIKKKLSDNKGFSLIELIIVLAILAILVGVLAPNLFKYIEKARESKRLSEGDAFRRCYETAVVDVATEGITPAQGGTMNIINGTLKKDGTGYIAANEPYNSAIKNVLDTIFTDNYEQIYYISIRYSSLGTMEEMYFTFADNSTFYNYAYSPIQPSILIDYELIEGSEWYRGPKTKR